MFKWIKKWALNYFRKAILKEIDNLSRYEDELAQIIMNNTNPDKIVEDLIAFVKKQLLQIIESATGWFNKFLGGSLVKKAEEALIEQVDKVDLLKADLLALVNDFDEDEAAAKIIVYAQDLLRRLVDNYIPEK